ncbi:phosphatase PAP2 family protein [Salibacterium aidingense]|uniref:phosphatase PAP2 family protein n=1 Tax=Salibacterium aidingense TaxID=384933 RepID=UPI003BC232A4
MDYYFFEQINNLAHQWDWLDAFMRLCSSYGYLLILLAVMGLFFTKKRSWGWIGVFSLLAALGLNYIIKTLVDRPQPFTAHDVTLVIEKSVSPSFPSDQAVVMGTCAVLFFFVYRKLGWAALLLALLVLFSRIYVGHHYPSDVVTGALLGGVITGIAGKLWGNRRRRSRFTPSYTRHFP